MSPLIKLLRLSWHERFLLPEAWGSLVAARLSLSLFSMRRVLNGASRPPGRNRRDGAGDISWDEVTRVVWAVRVAAHRGPGRFVCFPQGLAVQAMLRRRGIAATLCYGVGKDGAEDFRAHVWVEVAGRPVIGGDAAGFSRVAAFPAAMTP